MVGQWGSGHWGLDGSDQSGHVPPLLTCHWPALSPVAVWLQEAGNAVHRREGAGGPHRAPWPLCRRRAFRWPYRGKSQAHAELEFKPWDPRGKSRHPSSTADSQSSGLCWDDQPRTVPSPEARGQSQPPAKLPLKDTISRALQTGAEKCSLPP